MKEKIIKELVKIYDHEQKKLENKSLEELNEILEQAKEDKIRLKSNPNKFFYIKSLPKPKEVKTTTSTKAGAIVFIAFVLTLLLAGALFFIIAFTNNRG
ncbi:Uncharacterised protein [Mesomycoplasma conjunctivae]|uniref:Uncharacterized protein n=1 Tax=Mesomycoplasma conjunctivae (strain ATCC 25834 / NCTC 10147 / HRC/581) TaxID=572263 RepID=C5J5Q7_MESCH|nr:hypothetical protein [Mesomycoplasma conjunctivae]CAT04788.1 HYPOTHETICAL PROTEIN MCJ_001060 [Mesomycoplasma conjunctivae]VEU65813.1 Uncharacterised protein [Mesomycoplasma conjunctivae]